MVSDNAILSVAGPVFLVALWQQWRHTRLTGKPHYETTLNHKAMAWLDGHDGWLVTSSQRGFQPGK